MNRPGACIFDLDGVIVETAKFHFLAWKQLADSLGIPFDESDNEALKGISRKASLQKILDLDGYTVSKKEFQQLMDRKNKRYIEYIAGLGPDDILEGIPEFLKQLKEQEIKLAIGSSSKNARRILDSLQLNGMFETVIDGTQIEHTKPHPEVFLKASQDLQTPPAVCIVFEDAASGIRAAKAAGMTCVGVGDEEYLAGADLVISSFQGWTPRQLFSRLPETRY